MPGVSAIMILQLVIVFVVLIGIGVPIAFSMGIAGSIAVLTSNFKPDMIIHRTVMGVDDFLLVAVPMFILAGNIMERGDISSRLIYLAKSLLCWLRGGLPMSMVLAEMFFSGISGSTAADVSAMTAMAVPPMRKAGYSKAYSLAIICAASAFGILIPPCILMVVLSAIVGTSVLAVFVGSVLPTLILAVLVMGYIWFKAKSEQYETEPFSLKETARLFKECIWALGLPIIIFGGVIFGVATATEIAAVSVVYAFIVAKYVYKKLSWKDTFEVIKKSAITTGTLCIMFGFATIISYLLALNHVPEILLDWLTAITSSPTVVLVIFSLIFVIMGSVLEGLPAGLIFVPVFWPVAKEFGIDPIHFLEVVVVSIGLGLFIPPAGLGMIISCTVGKEKVELVAREFIPFLIMLLIGIIIIAAIPWLSTVTPKVLGVTY